MSSWLKDSTWRSRLGVVLFAVFSGVALLLASIGVYDVMAYAVAQQTQEIVIGLVVALPLTGLLGALLFQVRPFDPALLGAVMALVVFTGALAAAIPALRAANTDPLLAIRNG
jgi:putative ABC transport system permease protein